MKLKYSRFISVGLAIFLLSGISASAASLNGKALSAVDDVMSATGAPRVLKKDSLFIVTHDYEAQGLECSYVAFGEDNKPEAEVVLLKRGECTLQFRLTILIQAFRLFSSSTALSQTHHQPMTLWYLILWIKVS